MASEVHAGVAEDPLGALWNDPEWQEAYWADLAERALDDDPPADAEGAPAALAAAVHDLELDELTASMRLSRMLIADQYSRVARVLREAGTSPEPWVGADPTLDPGWVDPRDRTVAAVRRERREFAVRAAVADIAVRLRLSEITIRTRAAHADVLSERCPRLWAAFLDGDVAEPNAVTAAQLAASLPGDAADAWAIFDEAVTGMAVRLTPGKFRVSARVARERAHSEALDARHARAAADRAVWVAPELDGMAVLSARIPAAEAYAAMARVDHMARHLDAADDETRTLMQLRADVFADLVARGDVATTPSGSSAAIAVTVPALTLLGRGDDPAMLEGYGPIDTATAKRLAGGAKSWVRILTSPVTGVPLTLDRTTYRVPAALERWLGVLHPLCIFPGCGRLARDCPIDHLIGWAQGGKTDADNLAPECEPHHRVKTESLWHPVTDTESGDLVWVSPTGFRSALDPPPF